MKDKDEKVEKKLNEILNDLKTIKTKLHSDFLKIDIALLEEKIKKLLNK